MTKHANAVEVSKMFIRISSLLLAALILAGCSKKPEAEATPVSSKSKGGVSIESSSDAPPPPPTPVVQTDNAAPDATPRASQPVADANAELTPQAAQKQFDQAARDEQAYAARLKRDGEWLKALQKADSAGQQRILAEIRAAKLSPAEIQELEGIKSYFGVTVSFR